jgi:hypothetical protein
VGIQVFKGAARQRARLLGEIEKLETQRDSVDQQIAELQRRVAAFDEVLKAQEVDIDPNTFEPVKPTPRRAYFKHGELLGLCFDALRTHGRPLSTVDILDYAVRRAEIVWRADDDRYEVRRSIKNALGVQAKKGLVAKVGQIGRVSDGIAVWALPEYAHLPYQDASASDEAG